jgi:hypothetical protein
MQWKDESMMLASMKETSIYEAKVVRLFCFVCTYEIHRSGMLQIEFLVSSESSRGGGVHQLGFMSFGLAVQKFLNIE